MEQALKHLGMTREMSYAQMKKLFNRLALTNHPDKFPDEAQKADQTVKFRYIQEAWQLVRETLFQKEGQ